MTDEELDQRVRAAVLAEQIDAAPLERSISSALEGGSCRVGQFLLPLAL